MSIHTMKYTARNRLCKHALGAMVILYPRVEGCCRTEDQHQEQQDDVHAGRVSGRQYMAHGIPCQEKIRFSCEVRKRVSLRSYVRLRVRRWQRTRSEQLKEVRRRENPTWRVGFHRGRFEGCLRDEAPCLRSPLLSYLSCDGGRGGQLFRASSISSTVGRIHWTLFCSPVSQM